MPRITKAQKRAFLDCLGVTGNLAEASREAGFARKTANRLRERDEAFDRACAKALAWGLEALRDEAVERARKGWTVPVFYYGKQVGEVRRYSDALTIYLLKLIPPLQTAERRPAGPGEDASLEGLLAEINGQTRGIEGLRRQGSGIGDQPAPAPVPDA